MAVTRRTLVSWTLAAAVIGSPTVGITGTPAPSPLTLTEALNLIGPDGLISELTRGFTVRDGHEDKAWNARFSKLFTPAIRAAYARGPVTIASLREALNLPHLVDVVGDERLPAAIRAEALAAAETLPGFDLSRGRAQSIVTSDSHGYSEMIVTQTLLTLAGGGDQVAEDLIRGRMDWTTL